jgi:hypothetical protein
MRLRMIAQFLHAPVDCKRIPAEGGYDARALGHSIFTQAETLIQLREALKDAVRSQQSSDIR